jgi:hypothetical protein
MITDPKNISIKIQNRKIVEINGLSGTTQDWYVENGAYQVALVNKDWDYIIKIPNRGYFDAYRLIRDNNGFGELNFEDPITKYSLDDIKKIYALFSFHYENNIGPSVGRIFEIKVNDEPYFGFEMERLPQIPWYMDIVNKTGIEASDVDSINNFASKSMNEPGGILYIYRIHHVLTDHNYSHFMVWDEAENLTLPYKVETSIFYGDGNGNPLMYDVDINDIERHYNTAFIEDQIKQRKKEFLQKIVL